MDLLALSVLSEVFPRHCCIPKWLSQIGPPMEISSSSWVNFAKSAGDVVAQAVIQPGIMVAHALCDPNPEAHKKIAKNGQLFKQAVKNVITKTALMTKTWGEPSGSTQRLLDEGEAAWSLSDIKPTLRIFGGKRRGTEICVRHEETPDQLLRTLVNFGLLDAKKIVFITHGFMTTGRFTWVTEMKDALMKELDGEFVVVLDWGGGAFIGPHQYDSAAQNILTVGKWLAGHVSLMKEMVPQLYIWGVGHSLGAHLFGVAGALADKPNTFDRITALDPAGPGFENYSNLGLDCRHENLRLSRDSATFVDVIHTDGYSDNFHTQAIISPTNHYGTLIPLGHVDFYPNWGHSQPGCVYNVIGSHLRSIDLFVWSISNPGKFLTEEELLECPDYMEPAKTKQKSGQIAEMGFHCKSQGPRGNFYLETRQSPPYDFSQFNQFHAQEL